MITYDELESMMAVLLGGRAAEWIVFNHLSTGAVDDLAKVMDIARDMVMRFGMEKSLGPVFYESPRSPFLMGAPAPKGWNERRYGDQTAHAIGAAVQPIIEKSFERTVSILKNHRDRLERGAKLLLEKETLDEPNCGSVALSHKPHYLDCLEHCLHAPQAEKSSSCKKAFYGWWSGAVR